MADLDGENMADVWLGAKRTRTRPLFWRVSSANGQVSIRDGNWKYHHFRKQRGGSQLYDLSNDPAESHNLAEANPRIVRKLRAKIDEWVEALPADYIKKEKRNARLNN
jgi:arylsulfatase A-like enzyme